MKKLFAVVFMLSFAAFARVQSNQYSYITADITAYSAEHIDALKNDPNVLRWCEAGSDLILVCPEGTRPEALVSIWDIDELDADNSYDMYIAASRGSESPLESFKDSIHIVAKYGHFTLFQAPDYVLEQLDREQSNHFMIEQFTENTSLFVQVRAAEAVALNPAIKVSADQIMAYIKHLESYKTRYTYTPQFIESAQWAVSEFKKFGYDAKLVEYSDYGKTQYNVVAQKSFDEEQNGFYIICGHLDSTSNNASSLAPGADDNASGSAGVLEAARVLKDMPYAHKLRFVLFAGEEVGLKGSRAYVNQLKQDNEVSKVAGCISFDMIGFDKTAPLSSLIETKTFAKDFVNEFINTAASNGAPKVTVSYRPWGSDHVPFLSANIPCFLFIEDEFEDNFNYHKTTDTSDFVNIQLSESFLVVVCNTLDRLLTK